MKQKSDPTDFRHYDKQTETLPGLLEKQRVDRRDFFKVLSYGGLTTVALLLGDWLGFERARQVCRQATSGLVTRLDCIDLHALTSDPAFATGRFWRNSTLGQFSYSPDGRAPSI